MKHKQAVLEEEIDISKLRHVSAELPKPVQVYIEKTEPEILEVKKERKKKGEPPSFLKEDWRLEEDDKFYKFIKKYYKGPPEFKRNIKLTKDFWTVTDGENNFNVVKKKQER